MENQYIAFDSQINTIKNNFFKIRKRKVNVNVRNQL